MGELTVGVKNNIALLVPGATASIRGVANNGRRATLGINFLQLSTGKKGDIPPVWRPERKPKRLLFRGAIEPEVNPRDESTKQIFCVGSCGRSDIDHIEAVWRDGKPFLVS